MKKNTFRKTMIAKRICILFLSACMLAGSLAALNPVTGMTAQAASSTKNLKKKADAVVNKKTSKKDSKKEKLRKLFDYTEATYKYGRTIGFQASKGWEKTYAAEMYSKKKGSCYHFAAAYAFLAKAATNYSVRIGVGKTNGFSGKYQPHAWVEVKIGSTWYICDPNMDKFAEDCSGKYFLKKKSKLKKTYNNFKEAKYTNVKF